MRPRYLASLALTVGLLSSVPAFAALTSTQTTSVSAIVPTKVCAQYSSLVSNVTEVLADNSQKGTLTVKTYDCDNKPLADIPVVLTSNRGEIDTVRAIDSSSHDLDLVNGKAQENTDASGLAYFRTSSNIPGEGQYTAYVDNSLNFTPVKITYLPLPFPKNISVSLEVPKFITPSGKITLFTPDAGSVDKDKLVNLGVEFKVPLWVTTLVAINLLANLVFTIVVIFLLFRIRQIQNKDEGVLEQEMATVEKKEEEIEKIIVGKTPPTS